MNVQKMIIGDITFVLISCKKFACDKCYFDDNTCPNNGICIYGEGYWIPEQRIREDDELVPEVNVNKDWPFVEE